MKTWGIERNQKSGGGGGKPSTPQQIEHWFYHKSSILDVVDGDANIGIQR